MQLDALAQQEQREVQVPGIPELCDLAAAGLVNMLDPEAHLFCHIYSRTDRGMVRQGISPRYTMMTLLGLGCYERSGRRSPVAIAPVLEALLHDTGWIKSVGDLGLLLWTCAELAPEWLAEVYERVGAKGALGRFSDGQRGCTMEVAWYLTGIANCYLAGHADLPGLAEQATAARQILECNCGVSGVYGHLSRGRSLAGYVRGKIGSFADQVYPTIALARLAHALHDQEAGQMSLRTAKRMCDLQGSMGEWCWQYDSVTGRVVGRYPVYSVHQHAMGPMMLFAAGEGTTCDFDREIYKGLAWISGNNELHRDFIESSLGLVWRSIYLDSIDPYTDAAMRVLHWRSGAADVARLKVRYELGWLLYAFAGR
jgi:hypothetical protein